MMKTFTKTHRDYIEKLIERIKEYYGDNLISVVIFGSYAKGQNKTNSDLDILIVLKRCEKSRQKRLHEFVEGIEMPLEPLAIKLLDEGIYMDITPIILTKDEAEYFNPLYLDMVEHKIIIFDKDNFIRSILKKVKELMKSWNSYKEYVNGHEVWVIRRGKPIEVVKLG